MGSCAVSQVKDSAEGCCDGERDQDLRTSVRLGQALLVPQGDKSTDVPCVYMETYSSITRFPAAA